MKKITMLVWILASVAVLATGVAVTFSPQPAYSDTGNAPQPK
jgi:hypothetical protein